MLQTLRERREDIPPLAQAFADRVYSLSPAVRFSPEAVTLLDQYPWPGNIRELENAVVRAAAMCDGMIRVQDLPERVRDFESGKAADIQTNERPAAAEEWPALAEVQGRYVGPVLTPTGGNKQAAAPLSE